MRRIILPILLLLVIFACRDKVDPTVLVDNSDVWGKRDAEVATRLSGFKERHDRMATDFEIANAAADPLDSAGMTRRGGADSLLKSHTAKIAEIEGRLGELRARRDSLKTRGDQAALEKGWKEAEGEYGTILTRIDQLSADHDAVAKAVGIAIAPTDSSLGLTSDSMK